MTYACTFLRNNDRNDHTIDAENTCHDDWNQRFHNDGWLPNSNAADACSGLGGAISCSEICLKEGYTCQHQSQTHTHKAEEGRRVVGRALHITCDVIKFYKV
jgi:hypothetical protein